MLKRLSVFLGGSEFHLRNKAGALSSEPPQDNIEVNKMQRVVPDYYKDFKCIADRCKHNCCIGWEIDLDEETFAFYKTVTGDMGRRLEENISLEQTAHFMLGEGERCPFLNKNNLCDIITELGEEHICTICTEHPRFNNELPGRIETGLGLCCEEAARLILGKKETSILIKNGEAEYDEIVDILDKAIAFLQDRSKGLTERIRDMLSFCGAKMPQRTLVYWADFFLSLERLDEKWTECLELLKMIKPDIKGFEQYMKGRQTEYEQLLVYFIYRHLANACDEEDLLARVCFAVIGYEMIYAIGAAIWTEKGELFFEDNVEIARLFSSEIEYSEDNMDALLDELY